MKTINFPILFLAIFTGLLAIVAGNTGYIPTAIFLVFITITALLISVVDWKR